MKTTTSGFKFSVATLGDATHSTCSFRVAEEHFGGAICSTETFEAAAELVRSGAAAHLVVPAAYCRIADFYFDSSLHRVGSFLVTLPSFVLASVAEVDWCTPKRLFLHDAVQHLARKAIFWVPVSESELVDSNAVAAERALVERQTCVTNRWCAEAYGLTKTALLVTGVSMDFVVFSRRSAA